MSKEPKESEKTEKPRYKDISVPYDFYEQFIEKNCGPGLFFNPARLVQTCVYLQLGTEPEKTHQKITKLFEEVRSGKHTPLKDILT